MLIPHPHALKALRRWARIPDEQWPALAARLRPRRLAAREAFLRPGEDAGTVGLVVRGLLRFFYEDAEGHEATKAFRGPGELVAAYAELLDGRPSRTTIEAVEDCELLVAPHAALTALYDRHPCWQELGRRVAEDHYRQRERREQELLMLSAAERWRAFKAERPDLAARLPQKLVASYLGVHPVALSRIASRERARRPSGKR